jgi:hypothetical protein
MRRRRQTMRIKRVHVGYIFSSKPQPKMPLNQLPGQRRVGVPVVGECISK